MIQKTQYIRSAKLMQAYRKLPCMHCGVDDGTVCGAHSNQAIHGKARGLKSSDVFCASLCHVCHHALDQGRSMSRSERVAMWGSAHSKTVRMLVALGLWPLGVPVPEAA